MAKSVTDAAILLGALESAEPDPNDAATNRCMPPPRRDYTKFLKSDGLKGARIGIPRTGLQNPAAARVIEEAIEVLKQKGAIVVDPANIPGGAEQWGVCSGVDGRKGNDANCSSVFKYGMKRDFNRWLATLGPSAPVKTLTELREWNQKHERAGAIKYGQSQLDISDEIDLDADRAKYEQDRAKDIALAGTHGIDEAMATNRLDALLFTGNAGAAIAARPGYPSVVVPFALVANANPQGFPGGFDPKPGPLGITFTGMSCSEPRLIELAYAFEQATKRRVPPESTP